MMRYFIISHIQSSFNLILFFSNSNKLKAELDTITEVRSMESEQLRISNDQNNMYRSLFVEQSSISLLSISSQKNLSNLSCIFFSNFPELGSVEEKESSEKLTQQCEQLRLQSDQKTADIIALKDQLNTRNGELQTVKFQLEKQNGEFIRYHKVHFLSILILIMIFFFLFLSFIYFFIGCYSSHRNFKN